MEEISTPQYVYCLSNPSFEDKQKIGWTREYPTIRALNLFTSGVPTPFNVEFIIPTKDGASLESKIHKHIKQYRAATNREFFEISIDKLKNILTNELNIELVCDILDVKPRIVKNKQLQELNAVYERFYKEANEFINKLSKDKTKLIIEKINDKVCVSVGEAESGNCLSGWYEYECTWAADDEYKIKNTCYFIKEDLKQYEGYIRNINENYDEIKKNIGGKGIRTDNIELKKWISKSQDKLDHLLKKYEWVF